MKKALRTKKHIALIAHDNRKKDLIEWVKYNKDILSQHSLCATGTTGGLVEKEVGLSVKRFLSGPLGGDQQIGAKIAEGEIDLVIFLWDPLEAQPHDPDVKALIRIASLYNIPVALNRSTADFIISSHLLNSKYERILVDYAAIRQQFIKDF